MQRSIFPVSILALALAGCSGGDPDKPKTVGNDSAQATIPCDAGSDCETKWREARNWVEDNAHFPIAHSTDTRIDTEATSGSLYPVVDVRKTEHEDKLGSDIVFTATCQNILGCVPTEEQYQKSFEDTLNDIEPPEDDGNDIDTGLTFASVKGEANGATITAVEPQSPAARAGMRAGDRIVKFNGRTVATVEKLTSAIKATPEGSMVPIQYVRAGQTVVVYLRF